MRECVGAADDRLAKTRLFADTRRISLTRDSRRFLAPMMEQDNAFQRAIHYRRADL